MELVNIIINIIFTISIYIFFTMTISCLVCAIVNGLYLGYRGLYPQLLTRNRVFPMAHLSTVPASPRGSPESLGMSPGKVINMDVGDGLKMSKLYKYIYIYNINIILYLIL